MTITYRTAGAWGSGKGSNLTAAEVDGSFYDLDGRVDTLETSTTPPNGISNITVTGAQMYVHLDDATVLGPYTLPQANFRPSVVATISAATYTPVLGDANGYKRCTHALACAVTIPPNASVAFAVDTEITFRQAAAGVVSFAPGSGVTLNGISGYLNETAVQGAVVTLKKVSTDAWDIFGFLAEDVTA